MHVHALFYLSTALASFAFASPMADAGGVIVDRSPTTATSALEIEPPTKRQFPGLCPIHTAIATHYENGTDPNQQVACSGASCGGTLNLQAMTGAVRMGIIPGDDSNNDILKAVCCDFLNVTDTNTGKNTLVQFNDINATGDLGPDQLDLTPAVWEALGEDPSTSTSGEINIVWQFLGTPCAF